MLKRLQSVSMVLFLGTLFSGTISTATASGANSFATTQQAGICKGLVKDATGESVIGASVVVKGTTNGTITDFDGNFSLDGIKKGDVIVISYVGYQTQEIKWNGSPLNVILKEDSKTLSEVVVVGYGTQKKATLSGSVDGRQQRVGESSYSECIQWFARFDAGCCYYRNQRGTGAGCRQNPCSWDRHIE